MLRVRLNDKVVGRTNISKTQQTNTGLMCAVLTLLVRAGRSIGLRCACEKCGRPMYRPISFKLYSIRILHRMLEVFTRLQRAPHIVP